MYYPRLLDFRLTREINTRETIVVTGMRQVGKTTLLRHLYDNLETDNKAFFDLENPLHAKLFESQDYDAILGNLRPFGINPDKRAYLFIDEIQNLPSVSRVVKYLIDHYQTKFFLTGSSSYYLKNLFPESLAGRKIIFELYPLTFREFLTFKGKRHPPSDLDHLEQLKKETEFLQLRPQFDEFMTLGGFPQVVLETDTNRKRVLLEGIFQSYFEKYFKTLSDISDRSRLRDTILLLTSRIGGMVEIEKIASELGTTRQTIYSYLEFLEATYFISLLPRFTQSIDRSRAGRKKLYFTDTGLANFLGKLSHGQLLENAIFQTLRPDHSLTFWNKSGREIDFVVDRSIGLEVKTSASRRDLFNLKRKSQSAKIQEFFVVSHGWNQEKGFIPAPYF